MTAETKDNDIMPQNDTVIKIHPEDEKTADVQVNNTAPEVSKTNAELR